MTVVGYRVQINYFFNHVYKNIEFELIKNKLSTYKIYVKYII